MKCQVMLYLGFGEEQPCPNEAEPGKRYCRRCQGKESWPIKDGWNPRPPSELCGSCGKPLTTKVAYLDSDGWYLAWDCEDTHGNWDDYLIDWPFEQQAANVRDFEILGFKIL